MSVWSSCCVWTVNFSCSGLDKHWSAQSWKRSTMFGESQDFSGPICREGEEHRGFHVEIRRLRFSGTGWPSKVNFNNHIGIYFFTLRLFLKSFIITSHTVSMKMKSTRADDTVSTPAVFLPSPWRTQWSQFPNRKIACQENCNSSQS